MAKISYYALIFLYCYLLNTSSASKCVEEKPCSCSIDDYTFISLSQLRPSEGTFFQDSKEYVSYFFSGCEDKKFDPKEFKLITNETIKSVSLVKCNSTIITDPKSANISINGTIPPNTAFVNQTCRSLGVAEDIRFDLVPTNPSQYQIVFADGKSSNDSLPSIQLACDSTYNRTDLKILSSATDALVLYSPQVCVQHISHDELSGGSVFCIIFFVAAIVYFGGGALIKVFLRGARGVEAIPNFDFWVSLPGLMKDGLVYILSGCQPFTVSTAETYDRI